MNSYLKWFARVVWFGISLNLTFAFTALYAPDILVKALRLQRLQSTIWLRNVGMLLVLVSMFNAGAAAAPTRYPLYSWFVPLARLIASSFFFRVSFFNPHRSSERPIALLPLCLVDGALGLVCATLLQLGLPEDSRLSIGNFNRLWKQLKYHLS